MERIACRCGWIANVGMDCDFCGVPAEEIIEFARAAAELRDVCGTPDVTDLREVSGFQLR